MSLSVRASAIPCAGIVFNTVARIGVGLTLGLTRGRAPHACHAPDRRVQSVVRQLSLTD